MNFDDLAISAIISDLESAWNALIDEAIHLDRMNDVFALYATSGRIPSKKMESYLSGDWSEYSERSVPWAAKVAERAMYLIPVEHLSMDQGTYDGRHFYFYEGRFNGKTYWSQTFRTPDEAHHARTDGNLMWTRRSPLH